MGDPTPNGKRIEEILTELRNGMPIHGHVAEELQILFRGIISDLKQINTRIEGLGEKLERGLETRLSRLLADLNKVAEEARSYKSSTGRRAVFLAICELVLMHTKQFCDTFVKGLEALDRHSKEVQDACTLIQKEVSKLMALMVTALKGLGEVRASRVSAEMALSTQKIDSSLASAPPATFNTESQRIKMIGHVTHFGSTLRKSSSTIRRVLREVKPNDDGAKSPVTKQRRDTISGSIQEVRNLIDTLIESVPQLARSWQTLRNRLDHAEEVLEGYDSHARHLWLLYFELFHSFLQDLNDLMTLAQTKSEAASMADSELQEGQGTWEELRTSILRTLRIIVEEDSPKASGPGAGGPPENATL